jgi:hypothetical protein
MHGNFHIVSYKDYPLIPDKKKALPINFPVSDIRYQLVFEANDDIKCEELLLTWRAKPNGLPHKQTLPRWFYVDELVPFTDGSGKVAAIQYKGHTKHEKLAPADANMLKTILQTTLADDCWSELLPSSTPWWLKEHRSTSTKLATELLKKYQMALDEYDAYDATCTINVDNIEQQLAKLDKDLIKNNKGYQITISGHDIHFCWEDNLPTYDLPVKLKAWIQESGDDTISYIDNFQSDESYESDEAYERFQDANVRLSEALVRHPDTLEEGLEIFGMLIRSGAIFRLVWVIRMNDSDKALVAFLDLRDS